jgi:LytS/YehU family sensor histidine kinase
MKYLLPKLFFQKKIITFVLAGMMIVVLATLLLHVDIFPWSDSINFNPARQNPEMGRKGPPSGIRWMGRVTPFLIAFLGSTVMEVFQFANKKEKELIQSEKEKLDTELKFLKSQVNPHFLFNALNNIYSLAVVQAPQTPESVMQLSEILRYMVYDSNEEKVPLKSELNYIKNFVDLKLLKDSRGMDVELDLDSPSESLRISPLLLIPFVENAFKHSKIENLKNGFIKINFSTDPKWIIFKVVNSIPEHNFTKDEVGGVGLGNTKKRLELLYPDGKHQLNISETDDRFEVILKIAVQ